jgi:hypothetical protein
MRASDLADKNDQWNAFNQGGFMAKAKFVAPTDPKIALGLVSSLEKQVAKVNDLHLKGILLQSCCDIIDCVLSQHQSRRDAA